MIPLFNNDLRDFLDAIYGRRRNLLANGSFLVDSLNEGGAVALAGAFRPVDVWRVVLQTAGVVGTTQRLTGTAPTGLNNCLQVAVTVPQNPGAADSNILFTAVEGYDMVHLRWGLGLGDPMGIGFWVNSTVIGEYGVSVGGASGTRTYLTTFQVYAANTWEFKTVMIPPEPTGTWNKIEGVGAFLIFDLGSGANTETAAPNTWVTSAPRRIAGNVKLISQAATFQLAGVRVLQGYVDQNIPVEEVGFTLQRCLRYHPNIIAGDYKPGPCISATNAFIPFSFKVPAMSPVTGIGFTPAAAQLTNAAGVGVNVTAYAFLAGGKDGALVQISVAAGLVAGNATIYAITGGAIPKIFFSGAELV